MLREITLIEVRPRPLAAVRTTTVLAAWPSQFKASLDKVYEAAHAGLVQLTGQNLMVYYPRTDGRVEIDCGVEVAGRFASSGDVAYRETPGGRAATATHTGPYSELRSTHRAVADWALKNGHPVGGICWEIYGDWEEDPSKLETAVFHLIRERS